MSVDNESIAVERGEPGVVQLSVIGLAQSAGTVALSCIVPDGSDYTCSIASLQLAYGTSTTITITASSALAIAKLGSLP